jgi:hypothetical protein
VAFPNFHIWLFQYPGRGFPFFILNSGVVGGRKMYENQTANAREQGDKFLLWGVWFGFCSCRQ